jgi:hypothetical protein
MNQFARRSKVRPRGRERSRQMVVVAAIGGVLATGLFATREIQIPRSPAVATIAPSDDDEIYTGSILYMPYDGKICRQVLFDNRTGRLNDNGLVDCERAIYRSASATPNARARIISGGFRQR